MEIQFNEIIKIGDRFFGVELIQIESGLTEYNLTLSLFPVQLILKYIYPFVNLEIGLRLFYRVKLAIRLGASHVES